MKIEINELVYLSETTPSDKAAYLEHLKEKQIYDQTLPIPYPYTEADAEEWINRVTEQTRRQGQPVSWAIRLKQDGFLIGGVGFDELEIEKTHKTGFGYWLKKNQDKKTRTHPLFFIEKIGNWGHVPFIFHPMVSTALNLTFPLNICS